MGFLGINQGGCMEKLEPSSLENFFENDVKYKSKKFKKSNSSNIFIIVILLFLMILCIGVALAIKLYIDKNEVAAGPLPQQGSELNIEDLYQPIQTSILPEIKQESKFELTEQAGYTVIKIGSKNKFTVKSESGKTLIIID
jgi:flagellar basal body-associated protein FliL